MFCDADAEPALASADIDVLLQMSRRIDKSGRLPGDDDWEPAYDLNYAIAQGWLLKSTRTANRYLFMTGGKMLSRNQYYEHCIQLYYKFLSKSPLKAKRLGPGEDVLSLASVPLVGNS
jgi:hypothetical protein